MWKIIFFFEDITRWIYQKIWKVFHIDLYKNPQAIIPKDTWYCYNITSIDLPVIHTKPCPFHKLIWKTDICMLNGEDCMMDACKTCGINEGSLDE
jgi:hypothetical protein